MSVAFGAVKAGDVLYERSIQRGQATNWRVTVIAVHPETERVTLQWQSYPAKVYPATVLRTLARTPSKPRKRRGST